MKPAIIIIVAALFIVGLAGGYVYISQSDRADESADVDPASTADEASTPGSNDDRGRGQSDQESLHGEAVEIPDNPVMCKIHHVPEVVDPFCSPELVDSRGWCGGHNVPEALCTRCSPVLIAAFKAENDWCAEHGLPESQCLECNPETEQG